MWGKLKKQIKKKKEKKKQSSVQRKQKTMKIAACNDFTDIFQRCDSDMDRLLRVKVSKKASQIEATKQIEKLV